MNRTHYDKELKIWSGQPLKPLQNPTASLSENFLSALITNGSKIAQINDDSGIEMTFDETRIKAIRAALNLRRLGYKPKSIFGFIARNSANVAPIVIGSLFNGCPLNTMNPNFGKVELIHMLNTTKPCLMFCDLNLYDLVDECLKELEMKSSIFTFDGQKGNSVSVESLFAAVENEDDFVPVAVDAENDVAVIVCSSGTTGLAKGICISYGEIAQIISEPAAINMNITFLSFSPLYWITGIMILFAGIMRGVKRLITISNFSPELQFRLIEQYKVTHMLIPPYYVALSLKSELLKTADLSSVMAHIAGGCKMSFDLIEQWCKYLKNGTFNYGYGMSEVGGGICEAIYPKIDKKDTVGTLHDGYSVKIIDESGNRCGPNVDGEIYMKPPFKILGYFGNEKATRESMDEEGFVISGDIGRFDDDGYLYIVERKKDLLKYQNHQLMPGEIEDFLIQRPEIDSVCVVGIPDEMGSDLPTAVVIRSKNSTITGEEISKFVADHFADFYKLRGGVYFVKDFPVSTSGKLLRKKVRDYVIEQRTPEKQ